MQKAYDGYHRLGYWFLLLVPLVLIGFYKTYFSVILEPKAAIVHIHFLLMALWVLTIMVQPLLIVYKKIRLHRLVGRFSYFLVPALLFAAFLMLRYSYFNFLSENAINFPDHRQLLREVAAYEAIAVVYLLWLFIFYSLGIFHRHHSRIHARYMLAAAFTMLGPTIDRIWYFVVGIQKFPGNLPVETCSFLIADTLLVAFLIRDYRNRRNVKPLWTALTIYVLSQVLFLTVTRTDAFASFFAFIMNYK
jgi:hypothetical protein